MHFRRNLGGGGRRFKSSRPDLLQDVSLVPYRASLQFAEGKQIAHILEKLITNIFNRMALTATIYNLTINLADIDRGVYEKLDVCIARQPSETIEYMFMRVIAYCLEYGDGIVLTQGVAAGNEPAVLIRDLTGRVTAWIEVGMPDPDRLHRGLKLAGRAAIYTHRDVQKVLAQLSAAGIDRLSAVPVYEFDRSFVDEIAGLIERRSTLSISVTERELYLEIRGRTFTATIVEHRA
jgi:uncharacterized protein YaeQ